MLKTIKIKGDTHTRLLEIGKKGESFDTLLNRLMENVK